MGGWGAQGVPQGVPSPRSCFTAVRVGHGPALTLSLSTILGPSLSFVPKPGGPIPAPSKVAAPAATPAKPKRGAGSARAGGDTPAAGEETPLTGLTKPTARRSGRVPATKTS
jgi:hypothetical protein